MPRYRLRFFFSPGSAVCLWSDNAAAREKWDYSIDVQQLPLPENLWRFALHLCAWHDTSIDWDYPPGPSPWAAAERGRFNRAAQDFLSVLRGQLGDEFEVIDESDTAANHGLARKLT